MSTATVEVVDTTKPGIPFQRLVTVELRKMFNTRSGLWLVASGFIISAIISLFMLFLIDTEDLTFGLFTTVIAVPMTILLPILAILSVTSEWSQRSGLVTFTVEPKRGKVIAAKAVASIIVGAVSMLIAMAIGAIIYLIGATIRGTDLVWDVPPKDVGVIVFVNILGLLVGFMLGTLIRNSAGAIVAYFVYRFVLPSLFGALMEFTDWFDKIQPWIDFESARSTLYDHTSGEDWAHLGVSSLVWFVIPMGVGLWAVLKSEVK
jgi:ABC-type transport system involved in multi-copper enzyme maturation permease subunit